MTAVALGLVAFGGWADEPIDFTKPTGHFRVERPADLSESDALVVYDNLVDQMSAGYALSRDPTAERYRRWRRYNRTPLRSANHGERYVNTYANGIGRDYGLFEEAGPLPEGSIIAKDSFAVTETGEVFLGALFLMEKLAPGSLPATRDWRYAMILPDGSYFGISDGENAAKVEFCHGCHEAASGDNPLFFVPEESRVSTFSLDELLQ